VWALLREADITAPPQARTPRSGAEEHQTIRTPVWSASSSDYDGQSKGREPVAESKPGAIRERRELGDLVGPWEVAVTGQQRCPTVPDPIEDSSFVIKTV
jgi:hypothetical protein